MATRISLKAILLAALADIACTYGYGFVAGFTVIVVFQARRLPPVRAVPYLTGVPFLLAAVIAGAASALLGGFIAARIARTRELLHAALVPVPCMVLGVVLNLMGKVGPTPTWYKIAAYAAVIPAALMGGHLGVLRKQTLAEALPARNVRAAAD
jgi:hypothetical protein